MFYDVVIIGPNTEPEKDTRNTERVLSIVSSTNGIQKHEMAEGEEVLEGNLLELRKQLEFFELVVYSEAGKILLLHTKKIVLTAYTQIEENPVISLYEVLWAAKVKLDAITLTPKTNENEETSISRLYYRQKVSEN